MKSHRTANCCAAGKRRLRRSTPRRRRRQASGRRRDALSPRPFFARVLVAECFFLAIPHSQKKTKTKDKRRCRRRSVPVTPQTPVPKLSVKKTDYRFAEICKKKRRSREVIIVNRRSAVHLHQRPVGRRDAPLLSIRLGPGVSYLSALVLSLSLSLGAAEYRRSLERVVSFFFIHPLRFSVCCGRRFFCWCCLAVLSQGPSFFLANKSS